MKNKINFFVKWQCVISRLFHYLTSFFSLFLRHISDEECYIIGMDPKYARPDWMIVTALPGNFFMIILVAWLYLCACQSKKEISPLSSQNLLILIFIHSSMQRQLQIWTEHHPHTATDIWKSETSGEIKKSLNIFRKTWLKN